MLSRRSPRSILSQPAVVGAPPVPPTQQQQTITIWSVARPARLNLLRVFPKQELEGATTKTTGPTPQTLGYFDRAQGPYAPQLILPLPLLSQQTIAVTLSVRLMVNARRSRKFTSRLAPPAVVEPMLRLPDRRLYVQVDLVAIARRIAATQRQPHFKLLKPQVLFLPPPPFVALAAVRHRNTLVRRSPHVRVEPPTVLQVFAGPPPPATTSTRTAPRHPARGTHSRLQPPTVITPAVVPVFYGPTVVLDSRLRLARRPAHSELGVGIAEPSLQLPDRRLYVQVDLQAVPNRQHPTRRPPHSRLSPPTVVAPAPVGLPSGPLTVLDSRLRLARRPFHSRLGVGISEPSLQPQDSRLQILTRLVRTRPRRFAAELLPQAVPRQPTQDQQTIRTHLARIRPPRYAADVRTPTQLQTFAGPDVTLAGRNRLERTRRQPHYFLRPFIFRPQTGVIRVWLAVQNRLSRLRRRPVYDLQPPTATFTIVANPPDTDFTQVETTPSGRSHSDVTALGNIASAGRGRSGARVTSRGNQAETGSSETTVDT